jgi:hypothetical protein
MITKNSVNAKDAMALARNQIRCAPVSVFPVALANKDMYDLKMENALKAANVPPKSNQNRL